MYDGTESYRPRFKLERCSSQFFACLFFCEVSVEVVESDERDHQSAPRQAGCYRLAQSMYSTVALLLFVCIV